MRRKTLYIILIVVAFNFLLFNIFKLQKEIVVIRMRNNKLQNLKPNKSEGFIKSKCDKVVGPILNNNNEGDIISKDITFIMNELAELVPIDINKIYPSKEKFTSFEEQVNSINKLN